MGLVKFEANLSKDQFDKFSDFLVWLKNDQNFNDGSDKINKNNVNYKDVLYNLINMNPDPDSRMHLREYVDNTEFIVSDCGHFMTDVNNDSIKFLIKPFNHD